MKAHGIFRAGAAAALLGAFAGAPALRAQGGDSPYSYHLKVRYGVVAGDLQKKHDDNKLMGFGAEVRYDMPAIGGALFGELAYEIVDGRHHDVIPWGDPSMNLNMVKRWSVDDRMEYGQGFTFRLGYSSALPKFGPSAVTDVTKDIEWFAGLGIDRHKVRHEAAWALRNSTGMTNPANQPPYYVGGFGSFDYEGTDVVIGAFAGLRYQIRKELACEFTVRNLGMKSWDFTPGAYSGKEEGTLKVGNTRGWSFEFGLSLKL
jgi:hypothetical protein